MRRHDVYPPTSFRETLYGVYPPTSFREITSNLQSFISFRRMAYFQDCGYRTSNFEN